MHIYSFIIPGKGYRRNTNKFNQHHVNTKYIKKNRGTTVVTNNIIDRSIHIVVLKDRKSLRKNIK